MIDTRERILQTALELFAVNGFEAVSVNDISSALGVTKGALYKHYRSKRDIFTSIIARMEEMDAQAASSFSLPEGVLSEMESAYQNSSLFQLTQYSKFQFRYWTQHHFASAFRKMLTLEQYRSEEMFRLYQQYLGEGPLNYVADLLKSIGIPQPEQAALEFYAPMFLLYSVYDGAQDPESVFKMVDQHLDQMFFRLSQMQSNKTEL